MSGATLTEPATGRKQARPPVGKARMPSAFRQMVIATKLTDS
jgi:hypothetical protein